jgi:2-polyprenyl-3-methyl-5-hydroxy-6-metoxy-1,4-benzoquinol methylase
MINTKKIEHVQYFNKNWWFDINNPDSFSYFDLNSLYNEDYFKNEALNPQIFKKILELMKLFYTRITSKKLNTILELGSASGYITKHLVDNGMTVKGVEGSLAGYNKCVDRGLSEIVMNHDLRLPLNLGDKYDFCICTEVAEHIEPSFTSVLISNIVNHSDLVWFSFNSVDGHHHHSNCQPQVFWNNIFNFFNYGVLYTKKQYKNDLDHRLDCIFYNKSVFGELDENVIINL